MCLYRIIKSDSIVFSDEVYRIGLDTSKGADIANGAETAIVGERSGMSETDIEPAVESPIPDNTQRGETIDEDEIWQRLQIMLEEERKTVLDKAHKEAADILNRAHQEGLREGTAKRITEIDALISRIDSALKKIEVEIDSRLREYGKSLTMLTADIASKVLNQKIEQDDMILVGLIKSALEEFKNSEWVTLTLSNRLKDSIKEIEELIKDDMVGKLDIVTKEAPKGTCIIETSDGILDASVEVQLENLKEMLKQIRSTD